MAIVHSLLVGTVFRKRKVLLPLMEKFQLIQFSVEKVYSFEKRITFLKVKLQGPAKNESVRMAPIIASQF